MKRSALILAGIACSLLLVACGKSENKAPAPQAAQPMQQVQPAAAQPEVAQPEAAQPAEAAPAANEEAPK